jgi:CD2 antigen cytoplasmic tail-binding protein 2
MLFHFNSARLSDSLGIINSLEVPAAAKGRKEVRLEGYESDSSHGSDEGVRGARGTAAGGEGDGDDEEDMFATTAAPTKQDQDGDTRIKDSGLDLRKGANKAGKDFLELGDIEGQEFREEGEGDESDESYQEGDEFANTDDAPRSRRSKKGMGYVLRYVATRLPMVLCIRKN